MARRPWDSSRVIPDQSSSKPNKVVKSTETKKKQTGKNKGKNGKEQGEEDKEGADNDAEVNDDQDEEPATFSIFLEQCMRNEGYQSAGLYAAIRSGPLPEEETWQDIKRDSEFVFGKDLRQVFGSLMPKGPEDVDKTPLKFEIMAYKQKQLAKKSLDTSRKERYTEQMEKSPEEERLKRIHIGTRSLACDTKGDAKLASAFMRAEVESRIEKALNGGQAGHKFITASPHHSQHVTIC